MAEATKPTTTEIITLDEAQVEKALRGELAAEGVSIAIQDPRQVQIDIISRILESEDADAVFQGQTAISGRDVLGRAFTLKGVRWLKSKFDEGLPVFAVLDADMLDDGESLAITTSAGNVMAQAYVLAHKLPDGLPQNVKIVESEHDTAAGFRPQWLVRA